MAFNTAGALGGAGTGAIYGGQFGGVPGAVVGGLIGGITSLFGGRKKKPKKVSTFDPTQQGIYQNYANALEGKGGPYQDVFGPFDYDKLSNVYQQKYARPQYRNFEENIVPTITGQFRQGNLQNSSYLAGELGRRGRDVQESLDANLAEMLYNGEQASLNRRQRGVENILNTTTFDYKKQQKSLIDELLSSLAGGAGTLLANKFGGNNYAAT
jgi:hypothetical protein